MENPSHECNDNFFPTTLNTSPPNDHGKYFCLFYCVEFVAHKSPHKKHYACMLKVILCKQIFILQEDCLLTM